MTIGDEGAEEEQKKELRKKREAKKAEKAEARREEKVEGTKDTEASVIARSEAKYRTVPGEATKQSYTNKAQDGEASSAEETQPEGKKKQKKEKFLKKKASPRSAKYNAVATLLDKKKIYSLKEALAILPKLKTATFDETVELHINTTEAGITGSFVPPHGTGKKTRVTIVSAAKDPKVLDELIQKVESGTIDFDVLIATPDSMPRLAKVARFLGPKGLMPNPKNGTVTPKPEEAAKKYEAGQVNFKTEAKFPILHLSIGKMSFTPEQLNENIRTALGSVPAGKMRSITLKSTMSPGIKIDFTAI